MRYKVDSAVILAAGLSSRFVPISYEKHKGLLNFRGEILIERQIQQLQEASIKQIVIVVGYKKEQFEYLREKYGVILVYNPEYAVRNTHSSIYAARDYIKNSYICLADNYYVENPFEQYVDAPYYAAVYADGATNEWCISYDSEDYITGVTIGGENAWYMLGHSFFNADFSERILKLIEKEYNSEKIMDAYWENLYLEHINEFKMKMRRYEKNYLLEFDSLEELRKYDTGYIDNSGSVIMREIADKHGCSEGKIVNIVPLKDEGGQITGMKYCIDGIEYEKYFEENER